jgi:Sigma-70, region 4
MSRLDELPPDQRAALSLLLSQRKTYAEVATLLAIPERGVHDRAHAALAMLAPRQARGLPAERREEVGDYLLGQQPGVAERLATRAYLDGSEPAREWARTISGELAGLAPGRLPEIPEGTAAADGREAPTEATSPPLPASTVNGAPPAGSPDRSLGERLPSSRRGGALLLAAIAIAVIVAVVLITGGSSGSHPSKSASRSSAAAKTTTGPAISQRLTLTSPTPGSKAVGVMDILAEGSRRAFFIDAENLPESKGFFYALWLYNSPTSHRPLSASPPVGSTHRLQGGALLPSDAASYHTVLLTRETSRTPSEPGPIVLSGRFSLGA